MARTHGPALGLGTDPKTQINVWMRANDASSDYEIEYSTSADLSGSTTTPTSTIASATNDGTETITISGLTADTTYYYTPVLASSRVFTSNFPTFKTLPASMVGRTIAGGSCISRSSLDSTPSVKTLDYIRETVNPEFLAMLGDFIYAEDPTSGFTPSSDPGAATLAHYREAYRNTYTITAVENFVRNIPTIRAISDHDVMADFPDSDWASNPSVYPRVDAAASYSSWANAIDAFDTEYGFDHMASPNANVAGGIRYGHFVIGTHVFITLDTRSHRNGAAGHFLGETQRHWLYGLLNTYRTGYVITILSSDTFAGAASTNRDNWEGGPAFDAALYGYLYERDAVDAACAHISSKVIWACGDFHAALHVKTYGGIDVISASPFDDTQQSSVASIGQAYSAEFLSSGLDNRFWTLTYGANQAVTAKIYKANAGGTNTIEEEYSVVL